MLPIVAIARVLHAFVKLVLPIFQLRAMPLVIIPILWSWTTTR